jgi:Na+/phosphate symporter
LPSPALLRRLLYGASGLVLFLFALELVKKGAAGLAPLLRQLQTAGVEGALGFGWLMACVVLSGSPVAAVALGLLAGGTLSPRESLAMIVGSRLGASFVVLLVGALDDLRAGRREMRSAYVGVTALVATAVTYLPALLLALHGLDGGWLTSVRIEGRQLASLFSSAFAPLLRLATGLLHPLALFALGVFTLLGAFRVFDGVLPDAAGQREALLRARTRLERPLLMFAAGLAVTAMSMSVSMSLSILVPLVAKGYLRRESLWPYVLGANITTFDDTLFAAALVGHPDAVRIVLLLVLAVTLCSAPLVLLAPERFGAALDAVASACTRTRPALLGFACLVVVLPAALLLL